MKKWKKLSEKVIQLNKYRSIIKAKYMLPTGQRGDFYLNNVGRLVCALVITKDKQVVLSNQYRPGSDAILREIPGGGVGRGETPRQAVMREVLEETGYRGKPRFIVATNDDAWSRKTRYHYVVTGAVKVAEPKPDAFEESEVTLMSLSQFRTHLRSGRLTDVETGYLALDFLHRL